MPKVIMVQGTMSSAGKSLVVAGLCRIFKQDGYRVAPFKSQNMALNSFITKDGAEMGRAQVMQAEAAGIEPDVCMNPILLKPTNDSGSQVIVNGQVLGNMAAKDYFTYKPNLLPAIREAFRKLSEKADIIVIEGAGSPAEINLRQDDIVNMGLAEMVDAPVLLVGDIDRGGVFAQLLGTLMLLEKEEKERVKGLIINKFRGDKTILDPGIVMLKERGNIPVVGVTPYLQVEIEDEDSLTERFYSKGKQGLVDIAVIRTPRISNFTDFQVLENEPGISLRYVSRRKDLGNPDMIILPGTKNTIEDLLWLRQNGLEAEILKAAAKDTIIWGICGGYQMLGEWLEDPEHIEAKASVTDAEGKIAGIGLLPIRTRFTGEKRRTRVDGTFGEIEGIFSELSKTRFEGYEIHMGETVPTSSEEGLNGSAYLSEIRDFVTDQVSSDGRTNGNVFGTYIHGIFDAEEVNRKIFTSLAKKKGIDLSEIDLESGLDYRSFKELQYDILADALREHLDMKRIYEIMEEYED